jgi:uncharacterized protein
LALYYLETSALVKLYVRESGTDRLLEMTSRSSDSRLAILSFSQVEFRSAIRRRERNREIPTAVAMGLLEAFGRHLQTRFVTQNVTDFVLDIANALVDRYGLRAFDAIQLGGYAVLKTATPTAETPVFVCADRDLIAAAEMEGFSTFNPNL